MVKNLQCPVCTLYLHAGINLCDHLETHPKEQVIQALVQLTLLGNEQRPSPPRPSQPSSRSSSIELPYQNHHHAGATDGDHTDIKLLQSNAPDNDIMQHASTTRFSLFNKVNDLSNSSNSSHSMSLINTNVSNQNSLNAKQPSININDISFGENDSNDAHANFPNNSSQKMNGGNGLKFAETNLTNPTQIYSTHPTQLSILSNAPTDFTVINNQQYRQQHPQQIVQTAADYLRNNVTTTTAAGSLTNQQPSTLQGVMVMQNEMPTLNVPPPMHSNIRPAQVYTSQCHHQKQQQQQQQQMQQNLLHQQNIFPAELPPPPPLQLFTYQSAITSQHQKPPPPAYGTAISQIRSQSKNHHKYPQHATVQAPVQMAITSLLPPTTKHQQHQPRQRQQQQQQQLPQQLQNFQHSTTTQCQIQQHQPTQFTSMNSTSNQFNLSTKGKSLMAAKMELNKNLSPPLPLTPPPPSSSALPSPPFSSLSLSQSPSTSMQSRELLLQNKILNLNVNSLNSATSQTHLKNSRNLIDISKNANTALNVESKTTTTTTTTATTAITAAAPAAITTSTNVTYPSTNSMPARHTSSSCPILLATVSTAPSMASSASSALTASSSSSSTITSVLRYAESPVAHYLERDNGDFIVQETPKHIMEYVEKEDGEFSVIERIYQSPPSILHIHDEDEDEDDDDGDGNGNCDAGSGGDGSKISTNCSNNNATDGINSKRKNNNSSTTAQKSNPQNLSSQINIAKIRDSSTDAHNFSDIEDDFMSISGESDQEEFMTNSQVIEESPQLHQQQQRQQPQQNKDDVGSHVIANETVQNMNVKDTENHVLNNTSVTATTASTTSTLTAPSTAITITTTPSTPTTATTTTPLTPTTATTTATTMRKKSSKNTVTVLSDVQLNLSEYLDLVGNIMASSKISAQRKPLAVASVSATTSTTTTKTVTATAPLPCVKIEKEEPPDECINDDGYENHMQLNMEIGNKADALIDRFENTQRQQTKQQTLNTNAANKHETDSDEYESKTSEALKETILQFKNKINTNFDESMESMEMVEKKPNITEYVNKLEQTAQPSAHSSTVNYSGHATTSVIRMVSTTKQTNNTEHQIIANENNCTSAKECERNVDEQNSSHVEDLSKYQIKLKQQSNTKAATTAEATGGVATTTATVAATTTGGVTIVSNYSGKPPYARPLMVRKGPKKLIIKPKSPITKTDTVMPNNYISSSSSNSSSNNINNNNNNNGNCNNTNGKRCDSKGVAGSSRDDQKPSTSAQAKEEYYKLQQVPNQNHENKSQCNGPVGRGVDAASDSIIKVKCEPLSLVNYEDPSGFNSIIIQEELQEEGFEDIEKGEERLQEYHASHTEIVMLCKEEKPCITSDTIIPINMIVTPIVKTETNINDDAKVLYDFANSRKALSTSEAATAAAEGAGLGVTATSTVTPTTTLITTTPKIGINDGHEMIIASSNPYSSETTNSPSDIEQHGGNTLTSHNIVTLGHSNSVQQNSAAHNFVDYPFSFLYNNNHLPQKVDIKCSQTSLYHNVAAGAGVAGVTAGVAAGVGASTSSSSSAFSSRNVINIMMNVDGSVKKINQTKTNLESSTEWFHNDDPNNTSTSATITIPNHNCHNSNNNTNNSNHVGIDFNSSLSADYNVSLDDGAGDNDVVGKYLDLDACKHEQEFDMVNYHHNNQHQQQQQHQHQQQLKHQPHGSSSIDLPLSSSNSCSFTGNIDNSLVSVSGCAGGTAVGGIGSGSSSATPLNIRTDEKMPAKGEISEQESNCDIDNSWSQPMYGDISARFFKTSFPGMFTHDSGWHHDDCFTVQDLSASTTAQAQSQAVVATSATSLSDSNNRIRSFDLRLSVETNEIYNNGGSDQQIFPLGGQTDSADNVMPSTSAKSKKKRKRPSQDDKAVTHLQQQQHQHQQQQQRDRSLDLSELEHLPISSTVMPGILPGAACSSSNIGSVTCTTFGTHSTTITTSTAVQQQRQQQQQQKVREKVYECSRCFAKYTKLKDRNAHMINVHKYIRQNRKLVCPQSMVTSTITSNEANMNVNVNTNASGMGIAEAAATTVSNTIVQSIEQSQILGNELEDSKHGIIKVERTPSLIALEQVETNFISKEPKELEMDDDKHNLSLLPASDNLLQMQRTTLDQKDIKYNGALNRLGLNAPTTKLTNLYRMLVNYNMANLKLKQELSDIDEHLMESLIFYCHLCRQSFSSVKLYDIHLTEHPAECFSCGKKFQRWKNLSLHLKRHMGWKEFGCNVCDKKFVVRSALVEHMRMHSGHSPLKCKICGKHFKRYSNLTQHRKRHTKQVVRRKEYVCYCGEVLPSKARFLWHKETHDSKPKCCNYCCDRFIHMNSLKRHVRLAHSDKFNYVEPMECPICKQVFAKASMKSHIATHSTDSQFDCTICNKSFSTKWNLKIHSWVHANRTSKPFKCDHCPKAFVREIDFKNHINSHKQIRPYTCEVCGCKFIRKYNYMRHRREHHGDKKFTCDICKKSFHRQYYLIEHRRIHTGERPFQCTICGKSSTTKTNHNKHMKIHHSRDPFTVEV